MKIAIVLSLCLCSVWMSLGEARPEPPSSQYGVPSSDYDRGPAGYDTGPVDYGREPTGYGREPASYDEEPAGYGRGPMGYDRGPVDYDSEPAGFGGGFGGGGRVYNDPLAQDANYMFMYEVLEALGINFGHMEQRQGEVARGSYHVLLPDGVIQTVEYVADKDGYRPVITQARRSSSGISGSSSAEPETNNLGGGGNSGFKYST